MHLDFSSDPVRFPPFWDLPLSPWIVRNSSCFAIGSVRTWISFFSPVGTGRVEFLFDKSDDR